MWFKTTRSSDGGVKDVVLSIANVLAYRICKSESYSYLGQFEEALYV